MPEYLVNFIERIFFASFYLVCVQFCMSRKLPTSRFIIDTKMKLIAIGVSINVILIIWSYKMTEQSGADFGFVKTCCNTLFFLHCMFLCSTSKNKL